MDLITNDKFLIDADLGTNRFLQVQTNKSPKNG